MLPKMIEGHTRVLGKQQGYAGLPVRDGREHDGVSGGVVPVMATLWEPTPDELATLNAGGFIEITIQGEAHPPIRVETKKY